MACGVRWQLSPPHMSDMRSALMRHGHGSSQRFTATARYDRFPQRPIHTVECEGVRASKGDPLMTQRTVRFGKKTPGGAGTHTGHTGTHGHTEHTDSTQTNLITPSQPTNAPTPHSTVRATESVADSTAAPAAAPEPTLPAAGLRRGRPLRANIQLLRTRPAASRSQTPERLPAPARRRSAK